MQPEFFRYGTERVQEAFFCWLLRWAHPEHRKAGEALHCTGQAFIRRLILLSGIHASEAREVDVQSQRYGIDILVLINDNFALLIEGKLHDKRPDMLASYLNSVRREFPSARSCRCT